MSLNVKTCIPCRNSHSHNEAACTTCQSSERRSHDYGILAVIVSAEDPVLLAKFKTESMNYAETQLLLCSEEISTVLPPQMMKLKNFSGCRKRKL